MATDSEYDQCAEIFMNAIFYVLSNKMNFGRGVLIDGIDNIFEGFSKQHNKAAVYFTESYVLPEIFSIIEGKCKVYMGFLVSQNEVDYVKKYGCEQFEKLLEEKAVDVINIDRRSVI